jgi:hypothetical protein
MLRVCRPPARHDPLFELPTAAAATAILCACSGRGDKDVNTAIKVRRQPCCWPRCDSSLCLWLARGLVVQRPLQLRGKPRSDAFLMPAVIHFQISGSRDADEQHLSVFRQSHGWGGRPRMLERKQQLNLPLLHSRIACLQLFVFSSVFYWNQTCNWFVSRSYKRRHLILNRVSA